MTRDTRPDGRSSKRPPKKSDRLRDPHPPLMSSLHGLSGLDPTHDSSEAENFDTSLIYNDALGEANNSSQPKPFDASSIYDGVPAAEPSSKSRSRRRRRSGKRSKPDGLATSILDAIREVPGITKLFPKRIFKP
ncbi:hypothetical protein FRC11_014439 [Ceratobasidium sp. 423]|nr:hypothetical protein FRC11_014439 [Ceratobasidium sp. 423]